MINSHFKNHNSLKSLKMIIHSQEDLILQQPLIQNKFLDKKIIKSQPKIHQIKHLKHSNHKINYQIRQCKYALRNYKKKLKML